MKTLNDLPENLRPEALSILRTLGVVGLADTRQLGRASGLTRQALRRVLERLQAVGWAQPLRQRIRRTFSRGRSPAVWRLEKAGASALRAVDGQARRPSRLHDPRAIAHALYMLDLTLSSPSGIASTVDKPIPFQGGVLRPDLRVGNSLYEVEQDASPAILRRIVRSVRNKAAFFAAPQSAVFSPAVRMLVAVDGESAYRSTLRVWMQAVDVVREDMPMKFDLLAAPLAQFLDAPDWVDPPQAEYWTSLVEGGERTPFPADEASQGESAPLYLPHEDRLVLEAMSYALRQGALAPVKAVVRNERFLENMRIIYAASHDREMLSPGMQASWPVGSLYLLRHYLKMHPGLREQVERRMRTQMQSMRWNTTTILHRMQTVVDTFLAYHGYRSDGPLLAWADTPGWETEEVRTLRVRVRIRNREILLPDDGSALVPTVDEVRRTERALAWVLTALFRHAPDLGLKPPPFW